MAKCMLHITLACMLDCRFVADLMLNGLTPVLSS